MLAWTSIYPLLTLRLLSYSLDLHRSRCHYDENGGIGESRGSGGEGSENMSVKQRELKHGSKEIYKNIWLYYGYLTYLPVYMTGKHSLSLSLSLSLSV